MTRSGITALLAGLLMMSACASAPDYREASSSQSNGYSEARIESDRYAVTYRLNNDDAVRARSLAMRRAAELTLENGYDTFELVSQSSDANTERDAFARAPASERVVERNCGLLGCSTSVRSAPSDPFPSDVVRSRDKVAVTLEIIMSDKDSSVSPSLYDASEVFANLIK